MSVIDKEPFISQILNTLTAAQAVALKSLINGGGPGPVYRSLIPASPALLTKSEYANCPLEVQLEVSGVTSQRLYTGYLIFDGDDTNHEHCVLIAYSGMQNQQLTVIDIHYVNGLWDYTIKNSDLSIVELRMELDTLSDSEQAEVIETVKDAIADGEIPVGTEVTANPTLAGTESALEGIQIGSEKYKVGGGSTQTFDGVVTDFPGIYIDTGDTNLTYFSITDLGLIYTNPFMDTEYYKVFIQELYKWLLSVDSEEEENRVIYKIFRETVYPSSVYFLVSDFTNLDLNSEQTSGQMIINFVTPLEIQVTNEEDPEADPIDGLVFTVDITYFKSNNEEEKIIPQDIGNIYCPYNFISKEFNNE